MEIWEICIAFESRVGHPICEIERGKADWVGQVDSQVPREQELSPSPGRADVILEASHNGACRIGPHHL